MDLIAACNKAEQQATLTGLQHAVIHDGDGKYRVTRITTHNWVTDGPHVVYATKAGK
jgi:hypothetical protein